MVLEHILVFFFFFLSACVACLLFFVLFFLIFKTQDDLSKISAYECGFNPFEDAFGRFDIKFYLVAILFLIFDLEVIFLFPWSINLYNIQFFGFWSMIFFLFFLTLGFIYEWKRGALDW